MRLTEANMQALQQFSEDVFRTPYKSFPPGADRNALRKAGLIESWNPIMKVTGRHKPWHITPAGRLALTSGSKPE